MLNRITIGKYVPIQSTLHLLDPRTKLLITLSFIVIIFMANNLLSFILLFLYLAAAIYYSRLSLLLIGKGLKGVWLILAITFLFHLLYTREGDLLVQWGPFSLYEQGLVQGVILVTRLLLLFMSTTLLTCTTKPIALTDGLERLLHPLTKIGFPAHECALMISIALRFIPTLLEEAERIMKAQAARGADFQSKNIKKRMQHFLSLVIPLMISSFQRAEDLALAMEARAYRGAEGRTQLRLLAFGRADKMALFLSLPVLILLLLIRSW